MTAELLPLLERYYDEVPRANADTEEHGPFTVFVSRGGWPYYARPRLGLTDDVTPQEVRSVLARLEELGIPPTIEWVDENTPGLRAAALAAGVEVHGYPLMVLAGEPVPRESPAVVRRMEPDDPDLAAARAAVSVGFSQVDTSIGPASVAERDAKVAEDAGHVETLAALLGAGMSVMYAAFDPELGAVGAGNHNPRGEVTEIVGVGVLPAQRRRGIAGHLTWALARDAADAGVSTVFMSAGSDDVARIYAGVGFRRVGTACIAEGA
ncbi:MAG TPA: GNAT family N-acetyltransferase [Nocardioides sp.]|uniref:GNAT family N-acetyltransferase n=1 Tax=Nocardioides sp. TaxID=35761 RepID=UPI002E342F0F|nr:GNAT family N-acetyltransferase [Nocardioides sp.]HEX5090698.1 GNAT family N-acetyltransferase [Nocardioides sp.]